MRELVDAVGEGFGGTVDEVAERVGGELPAEVAGGFGVVDGVFAVEAGGALRFGGGGGVGGAFLVGGVELRGRNGLVGAEHDIRRIKC